MLAQHEIYVLNRGFVNAEDLFVGDQVYTLDGWETKLSRIDYIQSDFFFGKMNRIDCGNHNLLSTDETKHRYYSPNHGFAELSFNEVEQKAMYKKYDPRFYMPVLTWAENPEERKVDNRDLEYVARAIAFGGGTDPRLVEIIRSTAGGDCIVLIDLLEHWCSQSPGEGWFGRAQVKTRSHRVPDMTIADELSVVAARAGFTSAIGTSDQSIYLRINYESMPIPGSRPRNEKYYKQYYTGMVYTVGAGNMPILGRSNFGRVFYLPSGS